MKLYTSLFPFSFYSSSSCVKFTLTSTVIDKTPLSEDSAHKITFSQFDTK